MEFIRGVYNRESGVATFAYRKRRGYFFQDRRTFPDAFPKTGGQSNKVGRKRTVKLRCSAFKVNCFGEQFGNEFAFHASRSNIEDFA